MIFGRVVRVPEEPHAQRDDGHDHARVRKISSGPRRLRS